MHFNCTFCGGKIEGEEAWIGLDSVCPYCKMEITVPEPLVRDTTPSPLPTEGEAVSVDVDTVKEDAEVSKDVTFGGGTSGSNSIDLNDKWVVRGVLGFLALVVIMATVFMAAQTARPKEEKAYIEQLQGARTTVQKAITCWERNDFGADGFGPTMRLFCEQFNSLVRSRMDIVEKHPELKERYGEIRGPTSMRLTVGDQSVANDLRSVQRDMERALSSLGVPYY